MAQQIKLPDGRTLEYRVGGDTNGYPLLWIHGTPGSSMASPDQEAICKTKGLKLITMSRAGYGGSSRHHGRIVVDEVQDVQHLKEHLDVKECLVAGWSGGGKDKPATLRSTWM
jgi:pimeloyl-ACP methyl ester carboxylesterase